MAAVVALAALVPAAQGKEPVEQFLKGLRRLQLHDVAQEYIEGLKADANLPVEVKETLSFELGRTLIDRARATRDVEVQMKLLEQAAASFQEFIAKAPYHPLVGEANVQMGQVLMERGRTLLRMAQSPANAHRKEQLTTDARKVYGEAQTVFDNAQKKFEEEYEAVKKKLLNDNEVDREARKAGLDPVILARLQSASAVYEMALSYPNGTEDFKKTLEAASARYQELYEKFRTRLGGLYAGMYYGRCFQDQGNTKRALSIYGDLLAQPDQPEVFHELRSRTLALALKAWTSETERQFEVAAQKGDEWLKAAESGEQRTPEGLAIRYFTAVALERQIEAAEDKENPERPTRPLAVALLAHLERLADIPSEHQQAAKEMLARRRRARDTSGPVTFAEARDAAKRSLDAMQTAMNQMNDARLSGNAETQAQLPKLEKEMATARGEATRLYQRAMELREPDTSIDEINVVRYFLAYLSFLSGRPADAAVMGEFVARQYGKSAAAKPSAEVAREAWLSLYNAASPDDRRYEAAGVASISEYIAGLWPSDRMAEDSYFLLAELASRDGKLVAAADYFEKVSPESARRGEADLKAGQALWAAYLAATQQPEGDRPPQEELDKLVTRSKDTLARGIAAMRQGVTAAAQVTPTLLTAELSLAQIHVEGGKPEEALKLLELPDTGALALIRAGTPSAQGAFLDETFKAALRAYVGTEQIENAEKVMGELEAAQSARPDAAATLTRIYISLGQELERQVNRYQTENKQDELQKVLKGFETFLTRISNREEGNDYNSLNWVADTFYRLAAGLDSGEKLSDKAKEYYEKAALNYQNIIARKLAPTPQDVTGLEVRLARCQRRLEKYQEALDILTDILKVNSRVLEAQVEAAAVYQDWGAEMPGRYDTALNGSEKDKQTGGSLVWGWVRLANMAMRDPKLRTTYHEARYHQAQCRYQQALTLKDAERSDGLKKAEQDIVLAYRLDPSLGGPESSARYDALLKEIQKARLQKPTGLNGLKSPAKAAPPAATTTSNTR